MQEKEIETKVKKLSERFRKKVLKYVDFLLSQQDSKNEQIKSFSFKWEGKLKDPKTNTTSVELQHKSLEWR